MVSSMKNVFPAPGSVVERVIITKDESESNGNMELDCGLIFDDDSQVSYILESLWSSSENKYICCELEDDKYSRGIYEYKDGKYIQIEDWDN